ncbi:MAG TPA: Spy/CpxP family protein refolding chaperone [Mucilaginibacter sp.]|jgi:hypothetical protein|nr:Spy/CpxP family protein refolding chaperone [Mucilaginibacter sp.]
MKKLFFVCAFVIGISAVSHAQGGMRMSAADRVAAMKTSLALTDDQVTKITAIYTAQTKSMDSLRTAANGDMDAMREKMRPMMTATTAKVNAVLTADQQAAWKKQQDEMRAKRQQGGN